MTANRYVQMLDLQVHRELVFIPDHYSFAPAGRFQWLQRLAWKLLHKFNALRQAKREEMHTKVHVIDTHDVLRRVHEQRLAVIRWNQKPTRLVIGSDDFFELMGSPQGNYYFSFDCTNERGDQFMGLSVTVVPWMRGSVVLP